MSYCAYYNSRSVLKEYEVPEKNSVKKNSQVQFHTVYHVSRYFGEFNKSIVVQRLI